MSIEIPDSVAPGQLIKASMMNGLINAIVDLDVRLKKLEDEPETPPPSAVVVDSVTPSPVREGETVTIEGNNFGAVKGASLVTFDDTPPALITSWKDDEIVCVVPNLGVTAAGGERVFVRVDNHFTDDGLSITVLPPIVVPSGSLAVSLEDVTPDTITAGRDNDFKYTLRSDASPELKATITAKLTGQSWQTSVLDAAKNVIGDRQITIAPDASKTFFVRVTVPSGTNGSAFKLEVTASNPAPTVDPGTTTPLDFTVGQLGDPDTTFTMVPSTSSPLDAMTGNSVKARAGDITEIHLAGEFTAAGKYEVTAVPVTTLQGWDALIEDPQPNAAGKHVIEVTQQQIDGAADGKVQRAAQLNIAPDAATSPPRQIRLAVQRAGAPKARTLTFDLLAIS